MSKNKRAIRRRRFPRALPFDRVERLAQRVDELVMQKQDAEALARNRRWRIERIARVAGGIILAAFASSGFTIGVCAVAGHFAR